MGSLTTPMEFLRPTGSPAQFADGRRRERNATEHGYGLCFVHPLPLEVLAIDTNNGSFGADSNWRRESGSQQRGTGCKLSFNSVQLLSPARGP